MNNRDRFRHVLRFESVDRLPRVEWAPWWDLTIQRWQNEGLPAGMGAGRAGAVRIQRYLGLDALYQCKIAATGAGFPEGESGLGPVTDEQSYEAVRPYLYPEVDWEQALPAWVREEHARGELAVWFTLEGFFWFPRKLFGIERHLYAFYDQPALMKRICADLCSYHRQTVRRLTSILEPEFMTFAEDMSYNHGPMLSRPMFDEFMAPYYRELTPLIRARNVVCLVDSDGNIESCAPWFIACGVEGMLPLERQSGVDLERLRRACPTLRLIGGYDKMTMNRGTAAMRAEWERLSPIMRQGGYIPSVDHQTPPGVSLAQYRDYLALMRECTEMCAAPGQGRPA